MRVIRFEPIRAIEWVIALFTLLGGAYLFTPIYRHSVAVNGPGVIADILSHPSMVLFWGGVLVIGAILVMIGLVKYKPQLRSAGWFLILLARIFQLLTTFLVSGLLPILWIYLMTLIWVITILWAVARIEVNRRARD